MPVCPFGNHRLVLDDANTCRRCGSDLSVYAGMRDLSNLFFNKARRAWEVSDVSGASAWIQAALHLRRSFPEAYWLLAAVEAKRGDVEQANHYLAVARQLGAEIDFDRIVETPPSAGAAEDHDVTSEPMQPGTEHPASETELVPES